MNTKNIKNIQHIVHEVILSTGNESIWRAGIPAGYDALTAGYEGYSHASIEDTPTHHHQKLSALLTHENDLHVMLRISGKLDVSMSEHNTCVFVRLWNNSTC